MAKNVDFSAGNIRSLIGVSIAERWALKARLRAAHYSCNFLYKYSAYGLDRKMMWKYDIIVAIISRLFKIDIFRDFQEGVKKVNLNTLYWINNYEQPLWHKSGWIN